MRSGGVRGRRKSSRRRPHSEQKEGLTREMGQTLGKARAEIHGVEGLFHFREQQTTVNKEVEIHGQGQVVGHATHQPLRRYPHGILRVIAKQVRANPQTRCLEGAGSARRNHSLTQLTPVMAPN